VSCTPDNSPAIDQRPRASARPFAPNRPSSIVRRTSNRRRRRVQLASFGAGAARGAASPRDKEHAPEAGSVPAESAYRCRWPPTSPRSPAASPDPAKRTSPSIIIGPAQLVTANNLRAYCLLRVFSLARGRANPGTTANRVILIAYPAPLTLLLSLRAREAERPARPAGAGWAAPRRRADVADSFY
jgi:hypothetical protein